MARKGWDNLSPGQRHRYERAGVTRRSYDAGTSLTVARRGPRGAVSEGHGQNTRQALIERVYLDKERLFGGTALWKPEAALRNIAFLDDDITPRSIASLKRLRSAFRLMIENGDTWDDVSGELESEDANALHYRG